MVLGDRAFGQWLGHERWTLHEWERCSELPSSFLHLSLWVSWWQRSSVVLLQHWVANSRSIALLHKLKNQFVNIPKIPCWDLDWDCIEFTDQVGRRAILTILSLPTYECGLSFHSFSSLIFIRGSFSHKDFIHTLLDLYLSMSFCVC